VIVEQNKCELSETVRSRITFLRNLSNTHLDMLYEIIRSDDGNVYDVDLVIYAVIQRSLSLIDGFCLLVERQNVLCAAPLIRLQIDSLMRLNACRLVADPHLIVLHLLKEQPLKKVKSNDGRSLTDRYLHKKVSEIYPWVSTVYQKVSGFIHLSLPHMIAPIQSITEGEMTISVSSNSASRKWTENEMIEAIDAFTEATNALLHLCGSWLVTKQKVADEHITKQEDQD
jgi:hypothetical protein